MSAPSIIFLSFFSYCKVVALQKHKIWKRIRTFSDKIITIER